MYLCYVMYVALLNFAVCEAFFFWREKPIFFCFKVCPLYCSGDSKRRIDKDSSSLIYTDDELPFHPGYWIEDYPFYPLPDHPHWPRPTTENPKTTKATPEDDYYPVPYYYHWPYPTTKPTTTTTSTTTMQTTTKDPTYICVVCEKKCGYRGDR